MQFTDEQQHYIDKHYQLLPLDADGVPIHVGDRVYARYKSEAYGNHYYHNGIVESIEFEKDETYSYVAADDGDGNRLSTRELHHGSHAPTSGQIVECLVNDAFNLGISSGLSKGGIYSNATWEARIELVRQYTEQLRPLLSDDAE